MIEKTGWDTSANKQNRVLFSQFGDVGFDVDDDVDGAIDLAVQGGFKSFCDFVSGGDGEVWFDEDVQVEEDLSADRPSSKFVPLVDLAVGLNDLFDVLNGGLVNGFFSELAEAVAGEFDCDDCDHNTNGDGSDLVAVVEAELLRYDADDDCDGAESICPVVPGVGKSGWTVVSGGDYFCDAIDNLFNADGEDCSGKNGVAWLFDVSFRDIECGIIDHTQADCKQTYGDKAGGKRLDFAVAVGMLPVRLFFAKVKTEQDGKIGNHIGDGVDCVSHE